ncbi:O-6-methylguanine DNA methyltransferase [Chitinophaga sp. YR627]|uniref:methylated-DNA--[protein]-cysteine S-methyltransferase n=1 Tax=Chitinophaga sp. YR627 TaxID=1881041 RepID=UPI0008F3976F|nr:methylated-DNA--[protein]-cysteine S-methyltransferase [Chitinophaga sp. YR627]SFO46780.1 O-6-methylguanine DNA methyltransferase [Chitinophaga sp. YR627]
METQFKKILTAINKVAAIKSENDLFEQSPLFQKEERQLLEQWSGKTISQIKKVLSPTYGKSQASFNPFTGNNGPTWMPVIFSRFDENSRPTIFYSCENTDFGRVIIASTDEGICYLTFFSGDESKAEKILQEEFPASQILNEKNTNIETALNYLDGDNTNPVPLHVKGTPAQLKIWEALCTIPAGGFISYGTLAKATNNIAREVGIAMGDNRIAMLIPCHRVIKSTGELGQYHWGAIRKRAMIIKEAVII